VEKIEKKKEEVKILHSMGKSNSHGEAALRHHINFGPKKRHMIVLEKM
jgi:hypothetical protein